MVKWLTRPGPPPGAAVETRRTETAYSRPVRLKERMNRAASRLAILSASWRPASSPPPFPPPPSPAPTPRADINLGLTGHNLSFRGDFDGKLVLGNSTKLFYIPGPSRSTGFGLHFGCDVRRGFWRVSFITSSHRTNVLDRTSRATYNAVVLDGLAYLFPSWRVTPYLQVGINVPWVTVKDGSLYESLRWTDATYIGLGVNAGAGLCARIGNGIFIAGGPVYRPAGLPLRLRRRARPRRRQPLHQRRRPQAAALPRSAGFRLRAAPRLPPLSPADRTHLRDFVKLNPLCADRPGRLQPPESAGGLISTSTSTMKNLSST
jgi:hypothetical protein